MTRRISPSGRYAHTTTTAATAATARRISACAVSAAALVLVSACSVSGSAGGGGNGGLQRLGAASPAPTDAAGLAAKALKTGSVPGATVTTPTGARAPRAKDVAADKPCGPLARAVAGAALGSPKDTVVRRVTGDGLTTTVTLSVYEDEEKATAALTALSDAADACAHGFAFTLSGAEHRVTAAARELAPQGADQAMGFGITQRVGGADSTDTPEKIAVMRRGTTVAHFTTTATEGTAGTGATKAAETPEDLAVPPAVVEAQSVALA
ncbi:hypothetical protein [Streptomyces sp. NBC_00102]|uniref:hypothetical protein n=1 Tax=Streptomyces sp. NBC_00102 TaxID=2975652 RepID=UPI00225BE724|nr:hypothetical protein [Streptomyces sp. NBC_00102]MCX5397484.1 hypothetical protein [Streptomyces sp. NBC_00102]